MSGTKETESESLPKSTSAVTGETLPALSAPPTGLLPADISQSMKLLDESAAQMFSLMKRLNPQKSFDPDQRELDENPTKLIDVHRVQAACNCAKQIYSLARLKLDAIKLRAQIEGKL